MLGLAALAAGTAGITFVGLGGSIVVGGIALSGLATGIGLLVTPFGIATVAAGAFGYAIVKYTSYAGDAIDWLSGRFGPLVSTVEGSIKAITAAMSAGDMTTAWELTTDLMELVWLDLTGGMKDAWGEAMGWLLDSGSATAEGIGQVFRALASTFGGMLDAYKSTYDAIYNFTESNLSAAGSSLTGIETIGAPAPTSSAFEQQFGEQESVLRGAIDSIRQFGQNMSDEARAKSRIVCRSVRPQSRNANPEFPNYAQASMPLPMQSRKSRSKRLQNRTRRGSRTWWQTSPNRLEPWRVYRNQSQRKTRERRLDRRQRLAPLPRRSLDNQLGRRIECFH
jgi:hypothetical protein